jgi:hypothetical protein
MRAPWKLCCEGCMEHSSPYPSPPSLALERWCGPVHEPGAWEDVVWPFRLCWSRTQRTVRLATSSRHSPPLETHMRALLYLYRGGGVTLTSPVRPLAGMVCAERPSGVLPCCTVASVTRTGRRYVGTVGGAGSPFGRAFAPLLPWKGGWACRCAGLGFVTPLWRLCRVVRRGPGTPCVFPTAQSQFGTSCAPSGNVLNGLWLGASNYPSRSTSDRGCLRGCDAYYRAAPCAAVAEFSNAPGQNCFAAFADRRHQCWGVAVAGDANTAFTQAWQMCSRSAPGDDSSSSDYPAGPPGPAAESAGCTECMLMNQVCLVVQSPTPSPSASPSPSMPGESVCQFAMAKCLKAVTPGDLKAECACFGAFNACLRAVPVRAALEWAANGSRRGEHACRTARPTLARRLGCAPVGVLTSHAPPPGNPNPQALFVPCCSCAWSWPGLGVRCESCTLSLAGLSCSLLCVHVCVYVCVCGGGGGGVGGGRKGAFRLRPRPLTCMVLLVPVGAGDLPRAAAKHFRM